MKTNYLTAVMQNEIGAMADELEPVLRPLAGTTLLVTGGSGFLCSYFLDVVARLNDTAFDRPCRMICLDNSISALPQRIAHLAGRADFELLAHNVALPLEESFHSDWIIHGASIASPPLYRKYPLETIDANFGGTRNMLELARRADSRSIVVISTSEIYGDPDSKFIPTREDYRGNVSCTGPRACYDESKRIAETLCWIYHQHFSAPVKVVRPFNFYGPGQRLDDGRIVPDLISAALQGGPIVLYSDGRATRALCYIADAIRAMFHILVSTANGEAFNVGNDSEEVSVTELAERMREVAGPPRIEIQHIASADPHYLTHNPQRRCPDTSKLRRTVDWQPRVNLTEGLRRTLESCREVAMRESETQLAAV